MADTTNAMFLTTFVSIVDDCEEEYLVPAQNLSNEWKDESIDNLNEAMDEMVIDDSQANLIHKRNIALNALNNITQVNHNSKQSIKDAVEEGKKIMKEAKEMARCVLFAAKQQACINKQYAKIASSVAFAELKLVNKLAKDAEKNAKDAEKNAEKIAKDAEKSAKDAKKASDAAEKSINHAAEVARVTKIVEETKYNNPAQLKEFYYDSREPLLRSIFEKKNLVWTADALSIYKEWVLTYTPYVNRYKKMIAFVDANHYLFTQE